MHSAANSRNSVRGFKSSNVGSLSFFGIRSALASWKNAAELSELILPVA